ncbi:hypothetical protein [Alloactinosynnema sp. L-07]|uniref:DddA-like double-stranded DNA deaminase toxin n=1 Tax=Alloactinosynnema sp. L-07 TaxID=1653480 RepID=UPI00065EEF4F|nr:DddA-like double-stranded DNA deaminase toxin [Alloactinosynnema sp. L-07]CRK58053.1 hypothetical protein [Alloactinosynnema sp. L-07]
MELATRLTALLAQLDQVRHTIATAANHLDTYATTLAAATFGTTDAEIDQTMATLAGTASELQRSRDAVAAANEHLRRYLDGLGFGVPRPPGSLSPSVTGVENRHGDRYPVAALPYSDDLPPRVRRGARNSPMTGQVEIDGRFMGTVGATARDTWTEQVVRRVQVLGLPIEAFAVVNHVEMKTVAMLVMGNGRHARVVINHAPCGSEPTATVVGCEQFLPAFLPKGNTLTVHGTDAHGNPFERTYVGRASW